jgi:hypothetical protein
MSRVDRTTLVAVAMCTAWVMAAPAAFAVCAAASEESHFNEATVVFEGVAQPGATVNGTSLVSPATFVVERYLKGDGPSQAQVTTGTSDEGDGMFMTVSVGISPAAGERWRIFATVASDDGVWNTSSCAGSERIGYGDSIPDAADAGTGLDDGPVPGAPQDPSLAVPLLLGAVAITVGAMILSRRRRYGHAPPNVR